MTTALVPTHVCAMSRSQRGLTRTVPGTTEVVTGVRQDIGPPGLLAVVTAGPIRKPIDPGVVKPGSLTPISAPGTVGDASARRIGQQRQRP
ncbi:hypothetical protein GA0070615_2926 [Micromonospora aurantiaca]|nr:hypothetical protein GA0070615_2926 [Micromonospora aurantiaca]